MLILVFEMLCTNYTFFRILEQDICNIRTRVGIFSIVVNSYISVNHLRVHRSIELFDFFLLKLLYFFLNQILEYEMFCTLFRILPYSFLSNLTESSVMNFQ